MVHKLYVDSRASSQGGPSDFVWSPNRPISVPKCRAFVDSVHMQVIWGTVTGTNQFMYVAEELPLLTVLTSCSKVYLEETIGGGATQRIATIAPGVYDGPGFATALANALTTASATYTVSHGAVAGTLGQLAVSSTVPFFFASRAHLLQRSTWAGQALVHANLQQAADLMGLVTTNATTPLALFPARSYNKLSLSPGLYTMSELAVEVKTQLDTLDLTGYAVTSSDLTGRLTITCSDPGKFRIFPAEYLDTHPYAFQGHSAPWYASDDVTGFSGSTILEGNSLTAASHVNRMAYHTLFINSSLGNHDDSIGPMSQSTIARKVVIDQPPGGQVNDFHSLPYDYISLEKQSISAIRFRVTDWRGQTIEMGHWSLSLILVEEEQF